MRGANYARFRKKDTNKKVAIGPRKREMMNQAKPLRFFDWARPAFSKAKVPQPTKNTPLLSIVFEFGGNITNLYEFKDQ